MSRHKLVTQVSNQNEQLKFFRRQFLLAFCALLWLQIGLFSSSGAGAASSDRVVVMISVDGLAGFYFDDPNAEMPTIRALAAGGARAKMMKASTPTVTWPNHTTLVTGVEPAKHGVIGNNYFDRATGKRVTLIADPVYDKDQIVKVPTIYDEARRAGLTTASIRWPATRNASTLDWTAPDVGSDDLMKKYSTPGFLAECEDAGFDLFRHSEKATKRESLDVRCTRAFNLILSQHRPNLALLHLVDVDHAQHLNGPRTPAAYEAIREADALVRQVWEKLQKEFPGRATLLVVSDHGFSPVRRIILPNVILRKAGLLEDGKPSKDGAVFVLPQGGSAMVYVRDEANRSAILKQVKRELSGLEGLSKIVGVRDFKKYGVAKPDKDPHAPDLILFADEGYVFGDTAAGLLPFEDKPERKGSHGHDPNLPHLHATFVAWGAGIKSGIELGEISNTRVAPTIAALLKIKLPNADGKPLSALLTE